MISENPTPPRRKNKKGKANASSSQLMVGGGIIGALLLLSVFLSGGPRNVPDLPAPAPNTITPIATAPSTTLPPRSTKPATVKPKIEEPEARSNGPVWVEPRLVADPVGEPVSLLAMVNKLRDVANGELQQTPTALIASPQCSLYFPAKLPDDYQLKFTVRRLDGEDSLAIGFMMEGRQGIMMFDANNSTASGLFVDQREPADNCTARTGRQIQNLEPMDIELTVHPGHVHVALEGKTVVNWFGDADRLFAHANYSLPCRETAFLMVASSKFSIEAVTMTPIKAEPALKRPSKVDSDVAVIPLIDLARDIRRGAWNLASDSLRSPDDGGRIYLPTVVPKEYTLSMTAEIPDGQDDATLAVGLVADDRPFQLTTSTKEIGIDMIDGRRWKSSDAPGEFLKPGSSVRIDCTVTKEGIRAEVDGKPVIDWRGNSSQINSGGEWTMADGRRFYLATSSQLKLTGVSLGPPKTLPVTGDQPALTIGEPLDLLTVIDPARDALAGTWERDGMALKSQGNADQNKLLVPVDLPDEYKLTLKVSRAPGGKANNEGLNFSLPVGKARLMLAIDSSRATYSGLYLDNTKLNDSPHSRKGQLLMATGAKELEITVRATGVKVTSDGKKVIDWTGNPDRATVMASNTGPARRLWFGGQNQAFRFEKMQLEALESSSFPAPESPGNDGKLLPIVDVARDSRIGEWTVEKGRLASPVLGTSRLNIPVTAPAHYVFSAKVERKQGARELYLGLVVGGHPCTVVIDADQMRQAGIDLLDSKRATDPQNVVNRKYPAPLLAPNQVVQVKCLVLPDTILVACGDKEILRWHGDPRRLSESKEVASPSHSAADRQQLWLGTGGSAFQFRDLELKTLDDDQSQTISKSFNGVAPTTLQREIPFATAKQWLAEKK